MVAKLYMVYNDAVGKARILFALILLVGYVFPGMAFSQSRTSIVVLPFTGGNLSKTELMNLTLLFEDSLTRVDSLQVVDQSRRERVLAYLDPALLTCEDLDCAVRIGKALSAATVVMGAIVTESGKLAVSVRVVTVASGRSIKTDGAGVASAAGLPRAVRLLASALFGAPLAGSEVTGGLTETQENKQRLEALESLREDLQESIAQIKVKRRNAQTWGWVALGFGVASATLSGVSWYLSDLAYQDYLATSETAAAERYHRQVVLWDTIMLASAGTGVLSVGISIPIFALSPNSRTEMEKLRRVESDIAALAAPEGSKP
jgi:TolB-like protein